MKREAELRKKYEENLDKPITITQRQLMEAQAHVMTKGKFMSIAKERDPDGSYVSLNGSSYHG